MTRAQGLDVSRHQITTPTLTGRDFLIARATFGLGVDTMYSTHIANARKAGLIVGAYAFTYDYISAEQQADTFLKAAGDVDLYFVDVEGKDAQKPAQVQDFIDRVRSKGKRCGLYMSESGFYTTVSTDYRWVANWSHEPKIPWRFWQKRGSPLDLDEYNGTADQLRRFVGIPPAPTSDVETSVNLALAKRAVQLKGGRGIFAKAVVDSAVLIRNSTDGEVLELVGNEGGFQVVWLGDRGGFVANDAVTAFVGAPPPADCSAAVKAATDPLKQQLAVETARANAAESRVNNAKTALGCA